MKTFFLFLLLALPLSVNAQTADSLDIEDQKILANFTEEELNEKMRPPQFVSGSVMKYLSTHLKYPEMAGKYGIQGSVKIRFTVEKDGTVSHIIAADSTAYSNSKRCKKKDINRQKELEDVAAMLFAKEGERVVREMPAWKPGTLEGQPFRIEMTLPITFRFK